MIVFSHRFDGPVRPSIQRLLTWQDCPESRPSQLAFGCGQSAGNSRISLTRNIYRFGEGLEKRFDYVVWFVPIQKLQMQVAPGFVGKPLEKLPGEPESKS